ncbi:MAG: SH3 domain-containing protein [Chloroflexi bacterium]|nr:SH3 domain-containing protein [Chloroflexota bacterium]
MEQNPAGFASEDEEATYCLSLLRDGDRQQKIVARERLSQIFEQRGLLDEAAQCLESNIREGIRDPRVYQRLAGVYRRQGRHELADEVLLEARRLAERLQRGQQQGGRRGPGGRPVRGGPPPAPGVQDVTTRQLPSQSGVPATPGAAPAAGVPFASPEVAAARAPRSPAVGPGPGNEFDFDGPDAFGGPQRGPGVQAPAEPPPDRPWWLSPAMVVLLILLCGPYGLAMMWVRGNYPLKARKTAIGVWAGLVVLFAAAAAVFGQQMIRQQLSMATPGGLPGVGGVTGLPAAPTPIVFPPVPGGQPGVQIGTPAAGKPVLPPGGAGAVPSPPAVAGGSLGTPSGVTISPPGAPGPSASPATAAPAEQPSAGGQPASKPTNGEKVKVVNTGETGANMRERPGATAPVVKTVPEGTVLQVIGADQQMDGRGWRNVRDDEGKQGWIVGEFLETAP